MLTRPQRPTDAERRQFAAANKAGRESFLATTKRQARESAAHAAAALAAQQQQANAAAAAAAAVAPTIPVASMTARQFADAKKDFLRAARRGS